MASASSPGAGAANSAKQTARRTVNSRGMELLARFGYAAKGIVYFIIGWLAMLAAFGAGGGTTDRKGAVQAIYDQPFGKILLTIVVIGLFGYALWSLINAIFDTEGKGTKPKGIAVRIGYVAIAISYGALAYGALQLVIGKGNSGKSSDQSTQDWTAELLKQPFGVALVIIAALVVFGVAGYEFYKAYKAKFEKHLDLSQMSAKVKQATISFGRFGLIARGVVFAVIGIFLIVAALNHDASQAKGLGGALSELAAQPYGQVLLGLVAIGLISYGIYSFVEARYRRLGKA